MAVALTGTPQYYVDTTQRDGDVVVTIPADCTAVIVFCWSYRNNTAGDFDELNWDNGATLDFTQIVTNKTTSDQYDVWAYQMTSASGDWPGTGEKTLYFGFPNNPTEGGTVVAAFVKGLDTSDPVRSSESYKAGGQGGDDDWTATLADVVGDDLTFQCGAIFGDQAIDTRGAGQTVLVSDTADNGVDWEINYESGEGGPTLETDDVDYFGAIAFALKVAAAGKATKNTDPWNFGIGRGQSLRMVT